ncbi:oxidoreductase, partial [Halobacteriales archaeon QH_10_67_13]
GVALVGAAMVQSALVPFHGWLLASMTAPTPASALMHAGFVNAGGILLVRFAPVVSAELDVMLGIVAAGAASALVGKLLKTVQADVKGQLGCSTVGQMGFMIMQAGLGFFSAAVAHLILHGFYKAFQFLGSGAQIAHERPDDGDRAPAAGAVGLAVTAVTALLGGVVFTVFVGKGAGLDSGVVLTVLVVLMVVHATRQVVGRAALPAAIRYGAVPAIALPAIAVYGGVFTAVEALMSDLPGVTSPTELTVVHALVVGAFLLAYVGIDRGLYRDSRRLYVALLNIGRPPPSTVVTAREEYDDA